MNNYIISGKLLSKLQNNSMFLKQSLSRVSASVIQEHIDEATAILESGPIKTMTDDEIRQAFEYSFIKKGKGHYLEQNIDGYYIENAVHYQYAGWQGAFKYMEGK